MSDAATRATLDARFEAEEVFGAATGVLRRVFHRDDRGGHVLGVDVIRVRDGKVAEKLAHVKG